MQPIVDFQVYPAGGTPHRLGEPPVGLRVLQAEYAHDLAMVLIRGDEPSRLRYRPGVPVKLTWGWPGDLQTFVGYIHHLESRQSIGGDVRMWVVCIGPSYAMRESRHRVFSDVRVEWVLRQVATVHRLSALSGTSLRLPSVVQAGNSDWDLLVGMAHRVGATLYCHRTDLRCLSREVDRARAVLLTVSNALNNGRAGIVDWDPVIGETVPTEQKAWWESYGMTDGGKLIGATEASFSRAAVGGRQLPPVFTSVLQRPVHSLADARDAATGEAARHRHHQFGTAELTGSPKVHQGVTVQLRGLGRDADGYWYVTRAEHSIDEHALYRTTVRVGRDSIGDTSPAQLPGVSAPLPGFATRRRQVVVGDTPMSLPSSSNDAPRSVLLRPDAGPPAITGPRPAAGSAAGVLRHGSANLTMWQAQYPRLRMAS